MDHIISKSVRMSLFALLLVLFVSLTLVSLNTRENASASASGSISVSPELEAKLKSLQPNDSVLVWIDVQARLDQLGDKYLPADPALYGIGWIMVTFDPHIEQNNLFWLLAEVKAGMVQEIETIPWIKNISLIKTGEYEGISENHKFAIKGMGYAIQRAMNEGNESLQTILYMNNQTAPLQEELSPQKDDKEAVLTNVTALVSQLGGNVLKVGPYKNKLLARIPSQLVERVAENSYVSEIYLQGPIIFEGESSTEEQNTTNVSHYSANLATQLGYFIIFGLIVDCASATRKTRRRKLTTCIIAILFAASVLVSLPSVKALDVSTHAIRATDVWATGITGAGITVAVIDSGIWIYHPDFYSLAGKAVKASWNYPNNNATFAIEGDPTSHGTKVAGVIAGRNTTYRGVAWGSSLVVVKVSADSFDLDDAINWVRDNKDAYDIRVLSLSCAAPGYPVGEDGMSVYSKAVDDAIEAGIVVVKSAGNNGSLGSKTITTPGDAFNLITVGSIDDHNSLNISDYTFDTSSSRGPTGDGRLKPDVVAPGVDIWVPTVPDGYEEDSGTSFSAPHVAGTVALMLQANPDLTPAQVKAILRQTARLNDNLTGYTVNDRGYGIIDAYAAVQLAQNVSNIQISEMYDSFSVKTPDRVLWLGYDYLNFSVDSPSSTSFGISLGGVQYHYVAPIGSGDRRLLSRIAAPHVWIDGTYYNLACDVNEYLFSGPRIIDKGGGWVKMRAYYQIGSVRVQYNWYMGVDKIQLSVNYSGGSSWKTLLYIDTDVWGAWNYAYVPSTGESVLIEKKISGTGLLDIGNLDHTDFFEQIEPTSEDNPQMWILRNYPENYLYGNCPDSPEVMNGDYVYNRDIAICYQSTSNVTGGWIHRKIGSLPDPNPIQNDGGSGGDAGNSFSNATSIVQGSTYTGILCNSDPVDTDDYYKFNVQNGQSIYASLTSPQNANFNLQLYDPAGNLKRTSSLGQGCIDTVFLLNVTSAGNWVIRNSIASGEGQYSFYVSVSNFACTLKTMTNGTFYVPSGTNVLKIQLLFDDQNEIGDQTGGLAPYSPTACYPDCKVDVKDVSLVAKRFGKNEGEPGWEYMADVQPDKKIDTKDVSAVARNYGITNGTYTTNLTGVTVTFTLPQGGTKDLILGNDGFTQIPWDEMGFAVSLTIKRDGAPIGAMVIFWAK